MKPIYLESPDGTNSYLPIFKNASTSIRMALTDAGWRTSTVPPDPEVVRLTLVVWRDPVDRWVSAVAWEMENKGLFQLPDVIEKLGRDEPETLWIGDNDHWLPQSDFLGDVKLNYRFVSMREIDGWIRDWAPHWIHDRQNVSSRDLILELRDRLVTPAAKRRIAAQFSIDAMIWRDLSAA